MTNQRIIFRNAAGGVSVIIPAQDSIEQYGVEAIAQKDVPAGTPFKIIDVSDIPTDRSQRDAWSVDEADLTDGVGGVSNQFEVHP